jgi:hypothetical protein
MRVCMSGCIIRYFPHEGGAPAGGGERRGQPGRRQEEAKEALAEEETKVRT